MSAVQAKYPKQLKRSTPFGVSADIPDLLERLATRRGTSATYVLEMLVAVSVRVIVRCLPAGNAVAFIARVRDLAAQQEHAPVEVKTGWSLGGPYIDGIRQLQASLELSRQGLVVEYLVRASWAVEGDDDEGDGDELERRVRSASFANPRLYTNRQLALLKGDDPES